MTDAIVEVLSGTVAQTTAVQSDAVIEVVQTSNTSTLNVQVASSVEVELSRGPQGPGGNFFIGPMLPPTASGQYLWWQTGLGPDGTGATLWIEDGT